MLIQADLGGDMYFDIGWGQLELLECARNASGGLNYSKSRLVKVNCQHDQNAEVWDRKNLGEWSEAPVACSITLCSVALLLQRGSSDAVAATDSQCIRFP